MKIMSVNTNSNTLEFTLFEMHDESVIAHGLLERIGLDSSSYAIQYRGEIVSEEILIDSFEDAVSILFDKILVLGIVSSLTDIKGIGHCIVHGLDHYTDCVMVNEKVLQDIENIQVSDGFVNSNAVKVIRAFQKVLPDTFMACIFETAFHQTMKPEAYLYGVPYRWYQDFGVRKYGTHGISHEFIAKSVQTLFGHDTFKLISCHLANDGSICCIENMKCVDISSGFTSLSGIITGNKSGDVDSSIIPYIMEKDGKNASEVVDDLNKNSGLLGLSGISSNIFDIVSACESGNENAALAKNKYIQSIVDYIARYYALLSGVDIIVFTGNIGENCISIRREICERLACFGVRIDLDSNHICGKVQKISSEDSSICVYVIPSNEALMIAKETIKLLNR